jgi:hypothetical protein
MSGKRLWFLSILLGLGLLGTPLALGHPHSREFEDALTEGADTEARLAAIAEHLRTEDSEDAQCGLGSEMARIASQIWADLPKASDETIQSVATLVIGPTHEGKVKCLTGRAAYVLQMIGPRARFAAPALKKALAEAEAAEAKSPSPRSANCIGSPAWLRNSAAPWRPWRARANNN